jgi:hypothetical protein
MAGKRRVDEMAQTRSEKVRFSDGRFPRYDRHHSSFGFLGLGGSESDDNKRLNGSMKRMMISAVQRHFVNMTLRQMLREPVKEDLIYVTER